MNFDVDPNAVNGDEQARKDANLVTYWLKEIASSLKREEKFRTEGHKLVELYEGEKAVDYQFNILYSNTETLAPALYNSVPRPRVQRRFKDEDVLGGAASKVAERILAYELDDGLAQYASFDDLMKSAVLEALVPGRGVTRFKYDAVIEHVESPPADLPTDTAEAKSPDEEAGRDPAATAGYDEVKSENVCGEEVPWDRVLFGYAKKWKDVPWVSFDHFMTKEELIENFPGVGEQVPVAALTRSDEDDKSRKDGYPLDQKVALVREVWDKVSKKVVFLTEAWPKAPLKHIDDPLNLSGFFPMPEPITFLQKISTMVPTPLYQMYKEQAKELNSVTLRINKIIHALKVRGFYDGSVDGMDQLMTADDNTLLAAENVAALDQKGGLEKAIWLFPLEKLIVVLQQLYLQRNQVKQVIYEITGIADIMRGSSQASETLGAQEIKNQWGTLRLKRAQKEVARYARDCLRIMEEISVMKLSQATVQAMTGLQYPTKDQKQQLQGMMQQAQAQLQQQAAMQQPGQPPQPPNPAITQQMGQAQQILAMPSWEDILDLLRNELLSSFRIDIETNSTVDAEATEDKQNIAELLNAISQFLNGVAPLIQEGAMPFEVASSMLQAIVRRFQFGPELEDQLKKMKAPEPKQDPKAAMDMQMAQMDMEAKKADNAMKAQQMQMEMALAQKEHDMKMQEMDRKAVIGQMQHQQKLAAVQVQMQATAMKAAADAAKPAPVMKP